MISLHIVFLIIWSAALLYFPQMLMQQVGAEDEETRCRTIGMQHTVYVVVMTPSGLLTVLAGGWLLFERGFAGGWLPVKLSLVLLMVLFHLYCGSLMRQLKRQGPRHGLLFYGALSLVPAFLIAAVVTLVVAKPF